ncbi:hypothetical protein [Salisediminibacterium selenitireducens]|uniref:hypothetical protein n=1 Tax=Salisediminibacterium selenitireducens TaxID=85683 RepID=UPI0012D83F12|nr:hypothetical protein [Salisediminibacterium selenitireducens]
MNEIKSDRILTRLGKQPDDIPFSYEELTYFISLPNRDPEIYHSDRDKYLATVDYEGYVFPEVHGLMIELNKNEKTVQVAYLSLELLRAPVLERWKYEGKITESEYKDLRTFILSHSLSKQLIIEEVMKQVRRDDRILFIDEKDA